MPDTDPSTRRAELAEIVARLAPEAIELVIVIGRALEDGRLDSGELRDIIREGLDVARALRERRRHAAMVPGSPDRLT